MRELTSVGELRRLLGEPGARAANKDRERLTEIDRRWLAASPFCLVATSDADGTCDVSPKGDPPGFTLVLSDTRIAIPERPGNKRADGFRNILANPHVGLIYFLPGRSDTLRINGRARLVSDAPWFDEMVVKGHRPLLAVVVDIQQLFFHCAKAFLRSHLWEPDTWQPTALPSRAEIAHLESPDTPIEELTRHYGPTYADHMYDEGGAPDRLAGLPVAGFAFPGPLRDQLVAAILDGTKTSTTALAVGYELDREPLPRAGERSVVVDSAHRPVAVIEMTAVVTARLGDVNLDHAVDEGEGFATVGEWRAGHEAFWHSDESRAELGDPTFRVDDDTPVVLQRFRVVERLGATTVPIEPDGPPAGSGGIEDQAGGERRAPGQPGQQRRPVAG